MLPTRCETGPRKTINPLRRHAELLDQFSPRFTGVQVDQYATEVEYNSSCDGVVERGRLHRPNENSA